jgi:short-subunit dehydrogenase
MTFRAKPEDGIVWITGASRGIGRATAIKMANLGYKVAVTARSFDALYELDRDYENITAYPGDITDREDMKLLVEQIEEIGPISLAILNAGGNIKSNGATFGNSFRDTIDLNFTGTINCLEYIVPLMIKRRKGQIAVMSSISAYGGLPMFGEAYITSKAALISLCECIQPQLERKNVNVQIICPSFVDTGLISRKIFNTPLMISADKAADEIIKGLQKGGFEISFPKFVVFGFKLAQLLPYKLYFMAAKLFMSCIRK